MAKRAYDTVTIESVQGDDFAFVVDRATQYEVKTSLREPSSARFELGDEGTWGPLQEVARIGGRVSVSINGFPRVTGRMLTRNLPISLSGGVTTQLIVRTTLADARFTACTPNIQVKNVTIKDVILKAFERLGRTEADFIFRGDVARDLITGRRSGQPSAASSIRYRLAKLEQEVGTAKEYQRQRAALEAQLQGADTRPALPDIEAIQVTEAGVHPGEPIWDFCERHLLRYGMMMWDGPDGRIVVGAPDDSQTPLYLLSCLKGREAAANNLVSATKVQDYENVPKDLWVYGQDRGQKGYIGADAIKASEHDAVLSGVDPPLDRIVMIVDNGIRTQAMAAARARREMLARSISKDNWSFETDGLSYWSGKQSIPFAIDTVADMRVDNSARADGPYLIHECTFTGDANGSHTVRGMACGRGIWVI